MNAAPVIPLVMLVDDESFDQSLYRRIIARTGLVGEVMSFTYADEALAYLSAPGSRRADVIFLDINMPRMNGFEFLEAATQRLGPEFAKIVVVMLTTSLIDKDRERAAAFPVVRRFINKPLTVEHLQDVAQLFQQIR